MGSFIIRVDASLTLISYPDTRVDTLFFLPYEKVFLPSLSHRKRQKFHQSQKILVVNSLSANPTK